MQQSCHDYCARVVSQGAGGNITVLCKACSWGWRRSAAGDACELCETPLPLYDWLFLGFVVLLPFLLHTFFIDVFTLARTPRRSVLLQYAAAAIESTVAAGTILLLARPMGQPTLVGCGVSAIADWYTALGEPLTAPLDSDDCSPRERVFPLFSLPLAYLSLGLLTMLLGRGVVACFGKRRSEQRRPIYAALYFYPTLAVAHSLLAGLVYSCFPYLLLVGSVVSTAANLSLRPDQKTMELLWQSVAKPGYLVDLLTNWALFLYGLVAVVAGMENLPTLPVVLAGVLLVPAPALFYVATATLTDPRKRQIG